MTWWTDQRWRVGSREAGGLRAAHPLAHFLTEERAFLSARRSLFHKPARSNAVAAERHVYAERCAMRLRKERDRRRAVVEQRDDRPLPAAMIGNPRRPRRSPHGRTRPPT